MPHRAVVIVLGVATLAAPLTAPISGSALMRHPAGPSTMAPEGTWQALFPPGCRQVCRRTHRRPDSRGDAENVSRRSQGLSTRVLSTQEAITSAQRLQQILSGTLTVDLRQLQQLGSTLSNANEWDGPVAQRFRSEWPNESKALQQAITNLEALQKQAQQILQNIMKAGS